MLGATRTPILLGSKPVIVAEFLTFLNIAFGDNPNGAFGDQHFTVGVAGVVDRAGFVLQGLAVDIVAIIEFKNVLIVLIEAFGGFFLGNLSTNVLNNPRAFFDILGGKQSFACNARRANPDANFHSSLLQEEGQSPYAALCIRWRVARSLLRRQRRLRRCACVSGTCPSFAARCVYSGGVFVRKYQSNLR